MDSQAAVPGKGHRPLASGSEKAPIGWSLFVAQFITVALVFVIASFLPMIPFVVDAVITAMENPGTEPDLSDMSSPLFASTVVAGAVGAMFAIWLWLRREGRVREAIRLEAPANWKLTLILAVVGTVGTLGIFTVGPILTEALGLGMPDASFILDLVTESPAMFALWIVAVAWFAAGFGEEVIYRGFLMDRLERLIGLRNRPWAVLVIQALLFGLPHAYQGLGGMAVTASVGLLLGWIRNRCGGNLWGAILAHAAVDTISMSLAYASVLGLYGG